MPGLGELYLGFSLKMLENLGSLHCLDLYFNQLQNSQNLKLFDFCIKVRLLFDFLKLFDQSTFILRQTLLIYSIESFFLKPEKWKLLNLSVEIYDAKSRRLELHMSHTVQLWPVVWFKCWFVDYIYCKRKWIAVFLHFQKRLFPKHCRKHLHKTDSTLLLLLPSTSGKCPFCWPSWLEFMSYKVTILKKKRKVSQRKGIIRRWGTQLSYANLPPHAVFKEMCML